jgi:hypothetical protein
MDEIKRLKLSRTDAAKKGFDFFYTGKHCHKGHDSIRYVSNGNCVECVKLGVKQYRQGLKDLQEKARGRE